MIQYSRDFTKAQLNCKNTSIHEIIYQEMTVGLMFSELLKEVEQNEARFIGGFASNTPKIQNFTICLFLDHVDCSRGRHYVISSFRRV